LAAVVKAGAPTEHSSAVAAAHGSAKSSASKAHCASQ
jgi:hypothetical protein